MCMHVYIDPGFIYFYLNLLLSQLFLVFSLEFTTSFSPYDAPAISVSGPCFYWYEESNLSFVKRKEGWVEPWLSPISGLGRVSVVRVRLLDHVPAAPGGSHTRSPRRRRLSFVNLRTWLNNANSEDHFHSMSLIANFNEGLIMFLWH